MYPKNKVTNNLTHIKVQKRVTERIQRSHPRERLMNEIAEDQIEL